MPELPEVETIRRQLDKAMKGRVVKKVEVLRNKSFSGDQRKIVGWKVDEIKRKAKVIEIYFAEQKEMMIVHLKMTGQLIFIDGSNRIAGGHPTADWVRELPSKHTRVIVYFNDGSRLFFNDMRVFGWVKLVNREKYEKEMKKQVPDVIDKNFYFSYLSDVFRKTKKAVKLVLMDQEKIGGIGNIYANDALYLAKVMPDRAANSLTNDEIKEVYRSIKKVIGMGIKYGGASASDDKFVNISGLGGKYQEHFLVYQREGFKCKKCGGVIKKMKMGGRGTFYCPSCQK